ncbi:PREDICTED: WD repeat-containing protein 18-like [Priapulus caudatus]|uniref:WD repeat-containing protein 18-like n=1 Tax=Priapulus caudatus TaxID=37621 RepID=A0ABM1EEX2_PRICU|nr:PREDICTED: WD repeat-containing protein 18-like [Priapulus caudatus]
MSAPVEVILTSEVSGQLWNICVWDVHSGTVLGTFKGGSSAPRTLALLRGEYLISALNNKPLLHVWTIQQRDQTCQKVVCPGRVSALTTASDGSYCAAAISERIHIWEVSTGKLLTVLSRHYQTVNCLSFTDDVSHLVSGGEDNLVLVWNLNSVLCPDRSTLGEAEPKYSWSHHSLPVTDLYVGIGGARARVVTSSLDHTCKLYELASGYLLLSVTFDVPLSSVRLDPAEYSLFAGGVDGRIFQAHLFTQPVRTDRHVGKEDEEQFHVFTGHSKAVTSLSMTLDGSTLLSGSQDSTAMLWDISSTQCIRTFPHKGPVTNAVIVPTPINLVTPNAKPRLPFQTFKRQMETGESNVLKVCLSGVQESQSEDVSSLMEAVLHRVSEQVNDHEVESLEEKVATLQQEVSKLTKVNKKLYEYSVNELLK